MQIEYNAIKPQKADMTYFRKKLHHRKYVIEMMSQKFSFLAPPT